MPRATEKSEQKRGFKSAAIRELLNTNPKLATREVVEELGRRGIKVAPTMVYVIKNKELRAKRRAKRQRAEAEGQKMGVGNPADMVRKVKQLAAETGGLKNLKQLVDALAE